MGNLAHWSGVGEQITNGVSQSFLFGDQVDGHVRHGTAGGERLLWSGQFGGGRGVLHRQLVHLGSAGRARDLDRARRSRLDELEHGRHLQYTGLRYAKYLVEGVVARLDLDGDALLGRVRDRVGRLSTGGGNGSDGGIDGGRGHLDELARVLM